MKHVRHEIGGLLAAVDTAGTVSTADDRAWWYTYDGNGNVGQLLRHDAGTGAVTLAAAYEYDSYGNTLRADDLDGSGSAQANKFRFSTKYLHDELTAPGQSGALATTGLYYYGYRFYSPGLGRWINRDLIGELDGPSLYAFVRNAPVWLADPEGLFAVPMPTGTCYSITISQSGSFTFSFTKSGDCPPDGTLKDKLPPKIEEEIAKSLPVSKRKNCSSGTCCGLTFVTREPLPFTSTNNVGLWWKMGLFGLGSKSTTTRPPDPENWRFCSLKITISIPIKIEGYIGICTK